MRALKKLPHRDWLTLRDLWISHLPQVDLDAEYPAPTLWDLPHIHHPQLNAAGIAECAYVDGVREAVLREGILLSRKFIYCGTILPTLSGIGKNTWTAVAAYEAAFFAAKAFCYFLGFANLGRDSSLYLDVFHETIRKVGKSKIIVYETMGIHKLDDRLTHKVLWALVERLIDTTAFTEELRDVQTRLKIVDWDKFIRFRNRVVYDGGYWPLSDAIATCDISKGIRIAEIIEASYLSDRETSPPFGEEYFTVATLLRQLITGMLQTIANVAPAVNTEVMAFSAFQALEA